MKYEELTNLELKDIHGGDKFSRDYGYYVGRTWSEVVTFFEEWGESLLVWPD